MKTWIPLCLLVMAGLFGSAEETAKNKHEKDKQQVARRLKREVTVELDYLLYLPEGYEDKEAWPLIVFLHGVGERGENIDAVRRQGLPKMIDAGKQLPFVVVSPQCHRRFWWPQIGREVMTLVDEIIETHKVDPSRVYLTGLSMGGYGTWSVGCMFPERFAAILPICGGGEPFIAETLKDTPVWAFHGDADPVVPLRESQRMVDAINRAGGNARLTIYPGVGHDAWTQTYSNDAVYEWLLSHRKAQDQ